MEDYSNVPTDELIGRLRAKVAPSINPDAVESTASKPRLTIQDIRRQYPQYNDMTDRQLVNGMHKKFYSDIPYADFLRKIDFSERVDPTEGMSGMEKFRAGAGKAFYDIGRGAKQITGNASQESIDEAKALDAPLVNTGAGIGGNILGNIALAYPTMRIPGANSLAGATALGAGMGALQPVASGESRMMNTGAGALTGAAGQIIGNTIGRAIRPVSSRLGPEEQALAAAAQREGIPLRAGQATGSKPLQVIDSVLEGLPFTASDQATIANTQRRAFTQAALKRAGINANSASAAILSAQKKNLGSAMEQIAGRNSLAFDNPLVGKLASIGDDAAAHLPPETAGKIRGTIDRILSQVGERDLMSGTNYQGWRTPLRELAKSADGGRYYQQIKKALDEAFVYGLPSSDAGAFKEASRQYANLKVLIDAMGGPGIAPASGQLSPAQLAAALSRSIGREGKALGAGDLNEISRIGRAFVADQAPNAAAAQRHFVTNLLTGQLAGAVPGAGIGYYTGRSPESALEGAAIGAGVALGGPKLVQSLINSGAAQAYLRNGILPISAAERQMISNALRTGAIGAIPALQNTQEQ